MVSRRPRPPVGRPRPRYPGVDEATGQVGLRPDLPEWVNEPGPASGRSLDHVGHRHDRHIRKGIAA